MGYSIRYSGRQFNWGFEGQSFRSLLPRVEKKNIHPLDEAQIAKFLKANQGHLHEYLYQTALFMGLRQGEVLGLTWDCVAFKHETIQVKQQLQRKQQKGGEYYISPPKNNKARVVTIAPTGNRHLAQAEVKTDKDAAFSRLVLE